MFKKKKVTQPDQPVPNIPEDSKLADESKKGFKEENESGKESKMAHLTSDAKIKGTIKFDGAMRVDGKVEGKIVTDNGELFVGETGTVEATVKTRSAVIEGRVDGNITASDKVVLKQKARLIGDLQAKKLVIEDGVVFVGQCNVNHEEV
ncbi:MAG: Polymer-forming cytoskeletal [Candidatus Scalindua rubra]|uniref:Polymer-forming cytoskeletal n=1 Tax=Candidatus Scalindua rubra TaxID=1872076 RepID=A0A1E3X4G2_9BACT|nr:MAG: Polymer-forming cytoskeletal [Candidatus Scalindua rubra]